VLRPELLFFHRAASDFLGGKGRWLRGRKAWGGRGRGKKGGDLRFKFDSRVRLAETVAAEKKGK